MQLDWISFAIGAGVALTLDLVIAGLIWNFKGKTVCQQVVERQQKYKYRHKWRKGRTEEKSQ